MIQNKIKINYVMTSLTHEMIFLVDFFNIYEKRIL